MAKGFPIYSDLIIKLDPKNINMVQAQLRQTLSTGSLNIDIAKPIGLREYEDAIKKVRKESIGLIGDMQSLGERSTRVFARFSAYLLASGGILASISLMKDAIGQALKFNSELIRIKQVSGDSNIAIGKLADEVGRLSKTLGVSSSELIKSAVTLKQAGLSVTETTKALETLAQADLAPNFDSMAKTTEGLIAIYQQFGKNIDKVKTQLGSLNAVAGEFAVEASDLITVVQKTGGAAASSGASLEQLLGLFTSVRATTRESADSIATGLRTIFGRLQRPETIKFLDELGIKMRYTAEEAKAAGKNVGDFVGPFEAILRISAGTANMGTGSTLFSTLVEQIGGLRQISRVVPLIKESALAVEAWNVALAGQNSLYINSLQKQDDYLIKLKAIQETFLEMGRNLVKTKGFQELVSILGSMAKSAIELTDALGPLLPYLAQLLVINTAFGAVKSLSQGVGVSLGIRDPRSQKKMATGGIVPGSGSGDKIPALLEPGEAVIPKSQVSRFPSFVNQLISGGVKGFADGHMPKIIGGTPEQKKFVEKILKDMIESTGIKTSVSRIVLTDILRAGGLGEHEGRRNKVRLNESILDRESTTRKVLAHELAHDIHKQLGYKDLPENVKKGFLEKDAIYQKQLATNDPRAERRGSDREVFARGLEGSLARGINPTEDLKVAGFSNREINRVVSNPPSIFSKIGNFLTKEKPVPAAPGFTDWRDGLSGVFGGGNTTGGTGGNLGGGAYYKGFGPKITARKPNVDESQFNSFVDQHFSEQKKLETAKAVMATMGTSSTPINSTAALGQENMLPKLTKAQRDLYDKYQDQLNQMQMSLVRGEVEEKDKQAYRNQMKALSQRQIDIFKDVTPPLNKGFIPGKKETNYSIFPGNYSSSGEVNKAPFITKAPELAAMISSSRDWGATTESSFGRGVAKYDIMRESLSLPPSERAEFIKKKRAERVAAWKAGKVPPVGGGGGVGGVGGGGGGGDNPPPNDPNGISLDRVSGDTKKARFLGGMSSLAGIAIPLALGAGAAYSKDEETKSRFGAAASYSGIGAGVGSLFGPLGTLVGALGGGIYGWVSSGAEAAQDAAKKLQSKKLDESVEKLNLALGDLSEGRGSVGALASSLSDVRKNVLESVKKNIKPDEDFAEKFQDEFQKTIGVNLAKYQKLINEQLKRQAEAGTGIKLSPEYEELARGVVSARQRKGERFTMRDYQKDLITVYDAFKADKARKDADLKFVQQIDASVHSAKSFADAVQKAADAATEMDKKISVLSGGGYATPSLRLGEYGNINQGNLSSLSSFGGGMFSGLTSQVSGVNQVSKYLPEVLSRIIKPGEGSNTDVSISGAFEDAFNNIAKQTGEKFDKKVLTVLSNKLESMKTEDLFENFKKAPEQFADEMIKSFEPALKALESIGKNLEARDEAYQRGLSQLKEMNNRRNELFAQKSSMGIGIADIGDEISNNNLGIKQIPRFSNARNAFVSEQQRLAPGLDIDTIGGAITKEKANLRALQEKATEEARAANGSKVFADKVLESETRLNNLNKALSNLTNRSEELSRLQARRSELEARIEGKLGLAKSFYSADRQGLLEMNTNFGSAQALRTFGPDKIRQNFGIDFGADVFRKGMSTLEGPLGDIVLEKRKVKNKEGKTEEVEYTGKMIAQEILMKQLGIKGVSPVNERKQIEEILKEMKKMSSEGSVAVDVMLNDLNNAEIELYKKLKENNDSFTENLNRLIDELTNNARVAETAKDRTRLNEIEPDIKSAENLQGLDIPFIKQNMKSIKTIRQARQERDSDLSQSEEESFRLSEYLKTNPDIDEVVTKLPEFGFYGKSLKEAEKTIRSSREWGQRDTADIKNLKDEQTKLVVPQGDDYFISDQKKYDQIEKQIEILRKRNLELNQPTVGQLTGIRNQGALEKYEKTTSRLPSNINERVLSLPEKSLKLVEDGKEIPKIQKENIDLQQRINENQNRIREFEAAKAARAAQQQQKQQQEQQFQQRQMQQQPIQLPGAPVPQLSTPGPSRFAPRRGDTPLGPELGAMGSKLDKTFTDFSANVGKQVEALAAIPRVIEMNVKQTVEVIVNGAGALAMLEPTMKKVADAAVIKGIETIGGQLRAANIKINYDPSADGGAA